MILDYDAPLKTPKGETVENSSLGAFLYDCCLSIEQDMPAEKKLTLARIAKKIVEKSEVSIEELALIKERALKYAAPAIILSVEDLLENRT